MTSRSSCDHLEAITTVKHAKRHECEECIKTGDGWVNLRTCQTCGATLCCDSSPNRHATPARAGKRASCGRLGRAWGALAVLLSGRRLRGLLKSRACQGIKWSGRKHSGVIER